MLYFALHILFSISDLFALRPKHPKELPSWFSGGWEATKTCRFLRQSCAFLLQCCKVSISIVRVSTLSKEKNVPQTNKLTYTFVLNIMILVTKFTIKSFQNAIKLHIYKFQDFPKEIKIMNWNFVLTWVFSTKTWIFYTSPTARYEITKLWSQRLSLKQNFKS